MPERAMTLVTTATSVAVHYVDSVLEVTQGGFNELYLHRPLYDYIVNFPTVD